MKLIATTKYIILLLLFLANQACSDQPDSQQEFLSESILNTPFTAVVQHTQVIKLSSKPGVGDTYQLSAEVLEPIKGVYQGQISYRLIVEAGEDVILDTKPVIISLCEDNGELYWPGVGAEFPVSKKLIKIAHKAAKENSSADTNKNHCG
ncbi:hypothetical protein MO867_21145 [Microbulbifer sp. OS29]|uniref:Lipoprotein n=1 Tax=Microbulbifer okhotskensis TaxID=2926617 RepID=A0A9X2J758_9GAMM|nr:hypothetical protein [Microbulbifer okhotskensis]MCO1336838.1 hypothetical protein [Microbulbifer okhotskensis]